VPKEFVYKAITDAAILGPMRWSFETTKVIQKNNTLSSSRGPIGMVHIDRYCCTVFAIALNASTSLVTRRNKCPLLHHQTRKKTGTLFWCEAQIFRTSRATEFIICSGQCSCPLHRFLHSKVSPASPGVLFNLGWLVRE
jgi:hypothetical protein